MQQAPTDGTGARVGTHDIEEALLAERAAEWVHRLPNASPQQQAEFFRWLKQSPKHVREMLLAMSWDEWLGVLIRDTRG